MTTATQRRMNEEMLQLCSHLSKQSFYLLSMWRNANRTNEYMRLVLYTPTDKREKKNFHKPSSQILLFLNVENVNFRDNGKC